MSYHPIHDVWFLARCKYKGGKKRYGGYLGGFPERARRIIGAPLDEPMLHVCGGLARDYPYVGGFGPWDQTLDLDPECNPDFLQDAREPFPTHFVIGNKEKISTHLEWAGILIDPPYSPEDAEHYSCGKDVYPSPNQLVENALGALRVGRKVGIIHYMVPRCSKNAKFIFCAGIVSGFNNRIRAFSVYEKISS